MSLSTGFAGREMSEDLAWIAQKAHQLCMFAGLATSACLRYGAVQTAFAH